MNLDLKGKTVLITGSGSGMGQHMAVGYAQEGAKVAVVDVSGDCTDVAKCMRFPDLFENIGLGGTVVALTGCVGAISCRSVTYDLTESMRIKVLAFSSMIGGDGSLVKG